MVIGRVVARGCGALALLLAAASYSIASEPQPTVPLTLGKGTGGDGAWSAAGAAHSPTTVKMDETAGPEGTPAAVVEFEFSHGNYNWNWANVSVGSVDPSRFRAVRLTYRTDMPADFARMNVMLLESGGAAYWVASGIPLSPRRFCTVTVPFDRFTVTPWSKDANGKLDPGAINGVSIGFETGNSGKGRLVIPDIELAPEGW